MTWRRTFVAGQPAALMGQKGLVLQVRHASLVAGPMDNLADD
jgi:hypothetical protein